MIHSPPRTPNTCLEIPTPEQMASGIRQWSWFSRSSRQLINRTSSSAPVFPVNIDFLDILTAPRVLLPANVQLLKQTIQSYHYEVYLQLKC